MLRLAAAGLVAKEIAQRLRISIRTVEGHFGAMRQRAGARNMAELASWGAARGITRHRSQKGGAANAADAANWSAEANP